MVELNIKDIGAVEEFSYDFASYGLHVLKGKQGAGKTTILRVADIIANGNTDFRPGKRDGAPRGEATVAGQDAPYRAAGSRGRRAHNQRRV